MQRVRLLEPLRGLADGERVFIAEVSINGLRIVHQDSLGFPGTPVTVMFEWDGRRVSVETRVVHTFTKQIGDGARARKLLLSGVAITNAGESARLALKELVEWHVARALDEQKANARGIPAVAAQSFQTGKAAQLVRHELGVNGRWRETTTSDPNQPLNGFTISADQTAAEVAMLRNSFENGDGEIRRMIRQMAELSVSKSEGIPTRKYEP